MGVDWVLVVAEREREREQHADPAGVPDGRDGVVRDLRAGGRGGHERRAQRRRPGLRRAAAIGLRRPPRLARRLAGHRRVPDPHGLRAHRQALAPFRHHREQPHRRHNRAHQGRRRGRGAHRRAGRRRRVLMVSPIHGQYGYKSTSFVHCFDEQRKKSHENLLLHAGDGSGEGSRAGRMKLGSQERTAGSPCRWQGGVGSGIDSSLFFSVDLSVSGIQDL
jgi:hypothetical protein